MAWSSSSAARPVNAASCRLMQPSPSWRRPPNPPGRLDVMIFGPFERLLAGRYLRARRAEGFVSVIAAISLVGMMLGVGTLIVVMSVMGGFRTEFVSKILGLKPHIEIMGQGPVQDYEDIRAKVKALRGVVEVTPMVEGQALLTLNGYATGLVVKGLTTEDFKAQKAYADHIISGKADDFAE